MDKQEALKLLSNVDRSRLDPATLSQIDALLVKHTGPGKQGMSHYNQPTVRERLSEQYGGTVSNESDIPFTSRASLGFTDTPEEFDAKFQKLFPTYQMSRVPRGPGMAAADVVYQKPGEDFARRYDEPGFSLGDVADLSSAGPEIAGSLGMLAVPGLRESYIANILKSAVGAGAGYLGKEAYEAAGGHQKESLEDVLKQAGVTMGVDAAAGAIPWAGSMLRGSSKGATKGVLDDMTKVRRMLDQPAAPPLEPMMVVQEGHASPIAERAFRQSASTSPDIKGSLARQEETGREALESVSTQTRSAVGQYLEREGEKSLSRLEKDILRRNGVRVRPEAVGKEAQSAIGDFDTGTRKAINEAYGRVRQEAAGADMLFDLSPVQKRMDDIGVYATKTEEVPGALVDIKGQPLTVDTINKYIDVSADAPAQVNRAMQLIRQIDPVQTDWEVVKHLRSRVGDAIERWPSDATQGTGKAKAIWGELSRVMDNVQGATPGFKQALKDATGKARERFEIFEKPSLLALMKSDNYAEIANQMATPGGITGTVRNVLDTWAPKKADAVREHMAYRILSSNSPDETYKTLLRDNPEMVGWLGKTRDMKTFSTAVNEMQKLKDSPIAKLLQAKTPDVDMARKVIFEVGSPREVDNIMRTYGGRGSKGHDMLRLGTLNEVIDRVISITSDGKRAVNKGQFASTINDLKKSGVWDKVLTKTDRINLEGLEAYIRRTMRNLSDTGTSLEQAQLISGLKHPDTMVKSMVGLATNNRIIAPMMMSPRFSRLMIGNGRARTKSPQRWTQMATAAAAMTDAAHTMDRNGWLAEPSPTQP